MIFILLGLVYNVVILKKNRIAVIAKFNTQRTNKNIDTVFSFTKFANI